jgi:hypothetical protein
MTDISSTNQLCEEQGWLKTTLPPDVREIDCRGGSHRILTELQGFVLQPDGSYQGSHFHAEITDRYCIPNWIKHVDDRGEPTGEGHWEVRSMVIHYYRPKVETPVDPV